MTTWIPQSLLSWICCNTGLATSPSLCPFISLPSPSRCSISRSGCHADCCREQQSVLFSAAETRHQLVLAKKKKKSSLLTHGTEVSPEPRLLARQPLGTRCPEPLPPLSSLSLSLVSLAAGMLTLLGCTRGSRLTVPLTSSTPARRASWTPGDLIRCLLTVL